MSKEYDNNLRGALFKNTEKREGKKDPDYTGHMEVEAVGYWVSAWIEKSKSGQTYMSLRLNPKNAPKAKPEPKPEPVVKPLDFDDEIPFMFWLAPLAGLMAGLAHAAQTVF